MAVTAVGGRLLDAALAALAAGAALMLTADVAAAIPAPARTAALTLAAVYGAAVAARRVRPLAVLAVQAAAAAGYVAVGMPVFLLGPAVLVTLYTVGARFARRTSLVALAATEALLTALVLIHPWWPGVGSLVQFTAILAAAWFLGDIVRRWQAAAAAHARRAAELEAARAELARTAVTAERLRIARELHDIVAHSMAVVAMHAGTGRLAADHDAAAARDALLVVERTSRDALTELRRLVSVLRDAGEPAPRPEPAPGLPDVHRLIAEVAQAGVRVDVQTWGDLAAVPDGVSLAAYRIVQEALTNVVRHVGPAGVRVRVTAADDEVQVEVDDDGGPAPDHAGHRRTGPGTVAGHTGHGLVGMRERAAVYGGQVDAGPRPGGGWRVAGRLPVVRA